MNDIASFVARLKHWQVFLVTGLPFLSLYFGFKPHIEVARDPAEFEALFSRMMWSLLPIIGFVYIWIWSIGRFANRLIELNVRSPSRFFDFCFPYAFAFVVFAIMFFPKPSNFENPPVPMAVIFPLHILATVCTFYALAFSAKNLKMAEENRKIGFWGALFPFFMVWFFPVGVWFIQPRLNSLQANANGDGSG